MPTTLRGVINYTSNQPDRAGADRGREHFAMTLNADGSRSLRSHCVIQDAPLVERDVQLSVSADFVPQHALVRIRVVTGMRVLQYSASTAAGYTARVTPLRGSTMSKTMSSPSAPDSL